MLVSLEGRKCVVVGAGKVAADKIRGLLGLGGEVKVVSPRAVSRVRMLAEKKTLVWRRRVFHEKDVEGAFLVVAATDSCATNQKVFEACQARKILCNSVDDPSHCDFFYPAVVRRGPLQIAISTSGCSPALAARLRRDMERQFGPEWGAWVEHLGEVRRQLLAEKMSPEAKKRRLLQTATPRALRAFLRDQRSAARTQVAAKPKAGRVAAPKRISATPTR